MTSIIIICLIVVGIIVYSVLAYRNLTKLKKKVRTSWNSLNSALSDRFSLIPKFIILLQRLAPQTKDTLQKGIDAMCYAKAATTKLDMIKADKALRDVIEDLFYIYTQCEANQQDEDRIYSQLYVLTEKISSLRQGYNLAVKQYNNKVIKFPSKIIAMIFRFKTDIYYEVQISNKKEEIDSL